MRRLALIALLVASPALADDDACFELGGQGIAPCVTPHGQVAFESNLIDWTRDGHGPDRDDTYALGESIARVGLGGLTEFRVAWSPLILDWPRGGPTARGIDDLTLGAKHQFGKEGPLGLALQVTLPTAGHGVGQGTWSASAILPAQFKLNKTFQLDLTGEVDAAADADRAGRHFAASIVVGTDIAVSDAVTVTADVKYLRDDDPSGSTHATSASLAVSHTIGKNGQLTVGGVAGLDHDAPVAEAYFGFGLLF